MSKLFAVCLLAATWMLASASAHAEVSCRAVADEAASKGAGATVRDLTGRTNGDWDHFIDQVGSGRDECVQAAAAVAPGADAAAHEGVMWGLAMALQKNPEAVLAVLGGGISVDRVCGDPTVEGDVAQHNTFIQRTTAALSRVSDPSLRAKRDACLASLNRK